VPSRNGSGGQNKAQRGPSHAGQCPGQHTITRVRTSDWQSRPRNQSIDDADCCVQSWSTCITAYHSTRYVGSSSEKHQDCRRVYHSVSQWGNRWGNRSPNGSRSGSGTELWSRSQNDWWSESKSRSWNDLATESTTDSWIQAWTESWSESASHLWSQSRIQLSSHSWNDSWNDWWNESRIESANDNLRNGSQNACGAALSLAGGSDANLGRHSEQGGVLGPARGRHLDSDGSRSRSYAGRALWHKALRALSSSSASSVAVCHVRNGPAGFNGYAQGAGSCAGQPLANRRSLRIGIGIRAIASPRCG
jgi:hypothetical protein